MQSGNGGWGAFEPENTHEFLNNIPFADHGALLDPPTADVSARCLSMLGQLGENSASSPAFKRALRYLLDEQMADGSWYGRWGMNYIYGTWSALCALNAAGLPPEAPEMRRAAAWLVSIQNADGGWGEDGSSYRLDYQGYEPAPSVVFANRMGPAGPDGGGRGRSSRRGAGDRLPGAHAAGRWPLERSTLHRGGLPARVLPALPRLCPLLPALGRGALPQPAPRRHAGSGVGDVSAPASPGLSARLPQRAGRRSHAGGDRHALRGPHCRGPRH
ncbi:hypothetical protein ACU4GD_06220 [Cupriavidus basilensis]